MRKPVSCILVAIALISSMFTLEAAEGAPVYDLGSGKFKDPFVGPLKSRPSLLVKSLDYWPFSWCRPDTLELTKTITVEFNTEAVRSKSSAVLYFRGLDAYDGIKMYSGGKLVKNGSIKVTASDQTISGIVTIRLPHDLIDTDIQGDLIVISSEIDEINDIPLSQDENRLGVWHCSQKRGWPVLLWLLWLLVALLVLALALLVLYFVAVALYYLGKYLLNLIKSIPSVFARPAPSSGAGRTYTSYPEPPSPYSEASQTKSSSKQEEQKKMDDKEEEGWRERVRRQTGWSDTIIYALRSEPEANIYIRAGLVEKKVAGKSALIRNDIDWAYYPCKRNKWLKDKLSDWEKWSEYNNADLVGEGYPPRDHNGDPYELHHIGQRPDSPLAELAWKEHMGDGNNPILHALGEDSKIDRPEFDQIKYRHWQSRYNMLSKAELDRIYRK